MRMSKIESFNSPPLVVFFLFQYALKLTPKT